MSKRPTLRRKLLLARKAAEAVPLRGEADDYWYARAEDVLAEAARQLEKRGIICIPSVVEEELCIGKAGIIAKAVMEYEVTDTEGDESLTIRWAGTGHDSPGDKALFKAQTGAEKYFYAKLLGIPFGSDPETRTHPPVARPVGAPLGNRLDVSDSSRLLVMRDLRLKLAEIGAPADAGAVSDLLRECGISQEPDSSGLIPITPEQGELLQVETQRIARELEGQRASARPLPESDLPAPDWEGLTREGAGVDA